MLIRDSSKLVQECVIPSEQKEDRSIPPDGRQKTKTRDRCSNPLLGTPLVPIQTKHRRASGRRLAALAHGKQTDERACKDVVDWCFNVVEIDIRNVFASSPVFRQHEGLNM